VSGEAASLEVWLDMMIGPGRDGSLWFLVNSIFTNSLVI
jgi:hypothetical protein